jgi:uncharacterized protein (TIGR02466 family)
MSQVVGLFPTPIMRIERLLGDDLLSRLLEDIAPTGAVANAKSDRLSHSEIMSLQAKPSFVQASKLVEPKLVEFGALLFGENLDWSIKEIWVNHLETGGHQSVHNHANSFISGVVYLTPTHADARTVFMKSPGGTDFAFKNEHAGVGMGAYNADKWVSPAPEPGDVVLFPSYLMHAVPINPGERRISLAFNAIPTHLDSWGYRVSFSG